MTRSKKDLPYRTVAYSATPEEIDRKNRRRVAAGLDPLRYSLDEQAAIFAEQTPSSGQLLRWAIYPDEAVPLAALEHHRDYFEADGRACRYLIRRFDSVQSGEPLWSPLVDELAWRGWIDPTDRLRRLAAWLRRQENPKHLRSLATFKSSDLRVVLARHGRAFDRRLIDLLLSTDSLAGPALAANPAVSGPNANAVMSWAVRHLAPTSGAPAGLRRIARTTISRLLCRGIQIPQRFVSEVTRAALNQMGDYTPAAEFFLERGAIPPKKLESLYEKLRTVSDKWILSIIRHPEVPLPLLRRIAAENRSTTIRSVLARNDRAIADAEVRAHLLTSRSRPILLRLLSYAQDAERAAVISQLSRTHPGTLIDFVESGAIGVAELQLHDWRSLLRTENREIRLRSFLLLSRDGSLNQLATVAPDACGETQTALQPVAPSERQASRRTTRRSSRS